MSIEQAIRKYIKLANDERSRRIMMKKNHPSITNAEITSFEAEYRQIAGWLQELKERREAEMRMVNRKQKEFIDPYLSPIPAPPICEATAIDGIEEIKKGLDNYSKKLANDADMYIICEMAKRWIESIQRKEESK